MLLDYKKVKSDWEEYRKKLTKNGEGYFLDFLIKQIHETLTEKSEEYAEVTERTPIEYISASLIIHGTYEDLYEEVKEDRRLILLSEVDYGGSEGVYADIFCEKPDRLLNPVTIKTLNQGIDTIGDMGFIASMIIVQLREFLYIDAEERLEKE